LENGAKEVKPNLPLVLLPKIGEDRGALGEDKVAGGARLDQDGDATSRVHLEELWGPGVASGGVKLDELERDIVVEHGPHHSAGRLRGVVTIHSVRHGERFKKEKEKAGRGGEGRRFVT